MAFGTEWNDVIYFCPGVGEFRSGDEFMKRSCLSTTVDTDTVEDSPDFRLERFDVVLFFILT